MPREPKPPESPPTPPPSKKARSADYSRPPPPPPFRYGPPEKTNWVKVFLFLVFIILGIGAIVWMIESNPRMYALKCQTYNGAGLWSAFGRCQEEQ